jgi:hypothetical protein
MNIIATDEAGNTFSKEVSLSKREHGLVVSLGSPCSWYLNDIKIPPINDKMYIDAAGRNHRSYPVYISYEKLMAIVEELEKRYNKQNRWMEN